MKHLLFGINQNPNKKIENSILEGYKKLKKDEFTFDSEYYLVGIEKALSEQHYDVLILREDLESNKQVSKQLLDRITDKYPKLNIILIIKDEHECDKYIIDIFQLGIYNIIYKEDLTIPIVIELIDNVRTKLDAKIYLELEDVEEDKEEVGDEDNMSEIPEEQLITIMNNLRQVDKENISDLFDGINKQYEEKQMLFLVSFLPENIYSLLTESGNSNFRYYSDKLTDLVDKKEKKDIEKESRNKLERFKEKNKVQKIYVEKEKIVEVEKRVVEKVYIEKEKQVTVFERPNDYKKKAGFVGFSGAGKTTLVSFIANYMGSCKVKTAIIDLTSSRDLYDIFIVNAIEINEESINIEGKNGLGSLVDGEIRPFKIGKYIDLFTTEYSKTVNLDNAYYYIQLLEQEYDVILIDMDFNSPKEVYQLVNSAYIVQTLDLAKVKHNTNHQLQLKDHINLKKIKYVINQSIQCGISTKVISSCLRTHTNLDTFEKSEIIKEEVPTFVVNHSNDIRRMAYELSYNASKLEKDAFEAIKRIAEDIYPLSCKESNGIVGKLSKLGNLFSKRKEKIIKVEELQDHMNNNPYDSKPDLTETINNDVKDKTSGKTVLKNENEIREISLEDLYMED